MPDVRLGSCSDDPLVFRFDRVEEHLRVLLVNADRSGPQLPRPAARPPTV